MTTDGNYLVKNANTVKIPTINTVISSPTVPLPIGAAPIGIYYDSSYLYVIGSDTDIVYSAPISDPINLVPHKNAQVGEQSEFINNISLQIGSYFYSYGVKDDLGGAQNGSIYKSHIDTPFSWWDTGVDSASGSVDAAIYSDDSNIYLFGGQNSGAAILNTIDVAAIGTPTTFVASGNTLPAARIYAMVAKVDDTIYMYGGSVDGTASSNTIYSALASDPTTWTDTGSTLPVPIHGAAIYVDSSYVWIFGGYNSAAATELDTIYRAPIATPTVFTSVGTLPAAIYGNKVFVSETNLYMIGAPIGGGSGIQKASLSSLTSWTSVRQPALATAQTATHAAVHGSKIYAFGGMNSAGALSTVIQSANKSKPLEWSNEVAVLPAALGNGQLIKTSSYLYIVGGNGTTANDYRAALATPTTWALGLTTGPTRTFGSAIIIDNQLWYLGGETAPGTAVNTCSRAMINSGEIVSWKHNPGSAYLAFTLPITLSRFALVQAGDYIYILGGYTAGPAMNTDIYRVQKNRLAGSSGYTTWVNVGTITNAMVEPSVVVVNNTVYIIGGGPNTSFNTSDDYVLSANMTTLANGTASFTEENTATLSKAGATPICVNDDLYLLGGRSTSNGTSTITRNMGWSNHTLIAPKILEASASIPTADSKTGTLGSYSAFQRLGILPWLVTDK